MKKIYWVSLMVILLCAFLFAGPNPTTPSSTPVRPIKIGILIPYSGSASKESSFLRRGIDYALDEVGRKINDIPITIQTEDETDNPAQCIAKVKKLVDQDQVDVILGPLSGQNVPATDAYLGPLGVPMVDYGEMLAPPEKKLAFYPAGTVTAAAMVSGTFAYEELGARKAALIYQGFNYGQEIKEAFKAAFTAKGGTIVSDQSVQFGTMDMAPFLMNIGNVDVICVLLVAPSDTSFIRQYREFNIKKPVIFGEHWPQGEADFLNKQAGDAILGMYGQASWSPLIDTPTNKKLVQTLQAANNGILPGINTVRCGYMTTSMLLQALQTIKGDINRNSIMAALTGMKSYKSPIGDIPMKDRKGSPDIYISQAVRVDANNITWKPVKKYINPLSK